MEQTCTLPERRIAARIDVERPVSILGDVPDRAAHTVNVSTSGVLIAVEGELTIWAEVEVALPGAGRRFARVVRRDGARYGLVFREPLSRTEFADFTGHEIAEEVPEPIVVDSAPAPRVAPWAFGRDKVKSFRMRAARQVPPPKAR